MISALSGHINDWLAHIWLCMQEEDIVDMKVVEKAVLFCTETTKKLMNCHTQADHEECTDHLATVVDASGNKVYEEEHASMKHYVAWMWRELLVTYTSRNFPTDSILENAKRFKLVGKILKLMRKPNVDEGKKENADGYGFWDGHWSDAMKAASVQVRTALKAIPADERRVCPFF
ncbi:hypothetical protein CPC08DRAFT_338482 [Agrocybe pediades]|nr:hypothetical protein CPC08DRAFT_338482 [Agrocybe pediades]